MIVYCILLMLRFAVAFPASVEEGLTAWAALQRSAKLTKKAKGRIFLVLLVVYAVMYAVNLLFMLIFVLLAAIGAGVAMLAHVTQGSPAFFILIGLAVLGYLLVLVACTMFAYAAYSTTLAVLYHDQRLRKDGLLPHHPQRSQRRNPEKPCDGPFAAHEPGRDPRPDISDLPVEVSCVCRHRGVTCAGLDVCGRC